MNDGLYRAAFANSPIGMAFVDADGRISEANRALDELLLRYGCDNPLTSINELFIPNDRDASSARFELLSRTSGRSSWLSRVSTGARRGVWQIDVSVVSDPDDQSVLLVAVHDVTSQKRVEQGLKAAKLAAERATETKSAFLANMSHEIRTPIHTITGMTELLTDTMLDEEQREYADQVRFSADVLLFLINDILDFSKIEAGKLVIESVEFDPAQVVQDSVEMVCMQAHRKGVETIVHLPDALPRSVEGDPGRLRQVLVNLASNAVKFTASGQIVVRVSVADGDESNVRLRFEVEDTGVGIPEEKQQRLFTAFSQADSSTTRRFGGTGLGLSISKSLVEMMRGTVGLTSEHRVGSCFWFELPFVVSEPEGATGEPLDGCRVLLVDDNPTAANVISDYVSRAGADLIAVDTAERCIEALKQAIADDRNFDLVLIDLELPGMDGWQLASKITDDDDLVDTPRVLLSPIGLLAGEAKMKRLHWFQGYAKKPVRESELLEQIRLALNDVPELIPVDEAGGEFSGEQPFQAATIVIAEDHDVNQTLFRTILEKIGHRTILAADGDQAVEAVEQNPIDLVFMDVQMPGKNGYQATEELRAKGFGMPIIAVTANALKGEREKCIAAGMNDFLAKPFRKADLEDLLERWLSNHTDGDHTVTSNGAQENPNSNPAESGDTGFSVSDEHLGGAIDVTGVAVFDRDSALERFMGKGDIVDKVVEQFIQKHNAALPAIRSAALNKRYEEVRGAAHAIKGGAWSIDAQLLGNIAALLEASAKLEDEVRVNHYVDRLIEAMAGFEEEATKGAMAHESE